MPRARTLPFLLLLLAWLLPGAVALGLALHVALDHGDHAFAGGWPGGDQAHHHAAQHGSHSHPHPHDAVTAAAATTSQPEADHGQDHPVDHGAQFSRLWSTLAAISPRAGVATTALAIPAVALNLHPILFLARPDARSGMPVPAASKPPPQHILRN